MESKCAWCQIDTEKQMRFSAENNDPGCCPICKCYNDIGQKNISINSMRQIYQGCIELMDYMVSEFAEILEMLGIDYSDFGNRFDLNENEPMEIGVSTSAIVKKLFLSHTTNSGGTSTGNLKKILGVKNETERFVLIKSDGEE
jgi:arginyl-tRNA synthetase